MHVTTAAPPTHPDHLLEGLSIPSGFKVERGPGRLIISDTENDHGPRILDLHRAITARIPTGLYRVECYAGRIVVGGRATRRHNDVVSRLARLLMPIADRRRCAGTCSDGVISPSTRETATPDLLVVRRNASMLNQLYVGPGSVLAAEVTSPATAGEDRGTKGVFYARIGVPQYLIVDLPRERVELRTRLAEDLGYLKLETIPLGRTLRLPGPLNVTLDTAGLAG